MTPSFHKLFKMTKSKCRITSLFIDFCLNFLRIQWIYCENKPLNEVFSFWSRLEEFRQVFLNLNLSIKNWIRQKSWIAKFHHCLIDLFYLSPHLNLYFSDSFFHVYFVRKSSNYIISINYLMLLKGLPLLNQISRRPLISYRNLALFSQKEDNFGIKFDQEQIKRKMEEIKHRKEDVKKKPNTKLEFMDVNKSKQVLRKVRKFREETGTENLLFFSDPSLEKKPTTLQITGFDESSIEIDNTAYPPCLIVFKNQVLIWQVLSVQNLTMDDFSILKYIAPKPIYVIVGVNEPSKFPLKIREQIKQQFEDFDVLELFQATSQFNTTSNDEIEVVAFLLAK